jgi:glycosyltransferase involved in cell wall biosynthesis
VGGPLARRAAVVLGQNPDVARAFAPVPVVVEPNVAVEASTNGPRVTGANPVAVYAGRLLGLKGLVLAIEALRRPEATAWRLDVYGDGPQRRRLERRAQCRGVADRVRFLGQRPRNEVREALAHADALLFPSIRDAAGWSVAEAMAAGCPVVCIDAGGPAALVDAPDGVLVDPAGDVVGALADGLIRTRTITPRTDRWSGVRLARLLDETYGRAAAAQRCGAGS